MSWKCLHSVNCLTIPKNVLALWLTCTKLQPLSWSSLCTVHDCTGILFFPLHPTDCTPTTLAFLLAASTQHGLEFPRLQGVQQVKNYSNIILLHPKAWHTIHTCTFSLSLFLPHTHTHINLSSLVWRTVKYTHNSRNTNLLTHTLNKLGHNHQSVEQCSSSETVTEILV